MSFLDAAARRFAPVDSRAPIGRYLADPVAFARECFEWPAGESLTDYQAQTLAKLVEVGRVAVRGPHGLGKTTTNALAILWFALVHDGLGLDWKVPTTAGGWRQLERYLWPEVHKWAKRVRWEVVGRAPFKASELQVMALRLGHGEAFAVASDDPALIEGAHADHVLFVYDEAKSISSAVFDASEGAFSGAANGRTALALAQSTPGVPSGRFYDLHARKPGLSDWWVRHVRLEEAVAAGRVSSDWAAQRALQWGVTTGLYRNRVLGEFHSSDEDGVIPLSWVEAANERWLAWKDRPEPTPRPRRILGVDVSRSGADATVIAIRHGMVIHELHRHRLEDTMTTAGRVEALQSDLNGSWTALAIVDVIGIGAGVVDRLRQRQVPVLAFNASARSSARDRSGELGFLNRRAEGWWHLRELLDPAFDPTLALPPDDELLGDLVAPMYRVSSGRLQIESKDEIRKRLGRSPDAGDAVVMAMSEPPEPTAGGGAFAPWSLYDDGAFDRRLATALGPGYEVDFLEVQW